MNRARSRRWWCVLLYCCAACWPLLASPARLELAWPTPNPAFLEGKPIETFIQATASGDPRSGLFGCVRSGGKQFHEGIDLYPVRRDRKGEATDPIFAALSGVVRYINLRSGESNYGRYVVLEHPEQRPAVYTLYAHLSTMAPGLKVGREIERGAILGTMGRSASGTPIPRERAHLHFEIGLRTTNRFQNWYERQKFGSPNTHGLWNGMNLLGIDPLAVYAAAKAGQLDDFRNYFARLPLHARLRIATRTIPDFITRYPDLLTAPIPLTGVAGWELKVNSTGLPFAWTPLPASELTSYSPGETRVLEAAPVGPDTHACRAILTRSKGKTITGKDMNTILAILFGI